MEVRSYRTTDRLAVERIHFETGFLGSSMDALLTDSALWDAKIAWYLDEESEGALVLDDGGVVGYLVGCLDDVNSAETQPVHILKSIVSDAFASLRIPKQDRRFWTSRLAWLGDVLIGRSGERHLKTPPNAGHLHINLLPQARGHGYGTQLFRTFESYAREHGVTALHAESFETQVNPNTAFWERNGFTVFSRVSTTYWKPFVPEDMTLISYRKDISPH